MKAQNLKNSILQLAIQGKLVAQDANDEPAEVLYAKIQAEKQRLIKDGKIKKDKPLPPITTEEIPFDIPKTWKWVRLGDCSNLYTGNSIPENLKSKKYSLCKEGYDYISTKDVGFNYKIDYENGVKIPFDEANFKYAYHNSILLCIEGGSAGRKFAMLEKQVCFGNKLCSVQAFFLFSKFLFYFLQSSFFKNIFTDNTTGIIGGVSISKLKEIILPLPPLAEQHRIVAKIEELEPFIKQYDDAESELTKLNDTFPEQLKKSILQYAVQGKLVEQDANDEPAEVLYAKIQAEKQRLIKDGKIKKDKPLPPITAEEIPFDIPKTWKWVRLGELGLINPRNKLDDSLDVTFLPMTNLYSEYGKKADTSIIKKWKELKSGYTHIAENDVVMAKITPCFENGKSAIINELMNGYGGATTELHVFRSITDICLKYILLYLKSPFFVSHAIANMTGTAGQQRVPVSIFSDYYFPLPPLAEQHRIVAKIEQLLANAENLKM